MRVVIMLRSLICQLFGCTFYEGVHRTCYCRRCGWRDRTLREQYDWDDTSHFGCGVSPGDFGDQ